MQRIPQGDRITRDLGENNRHAYSPFPLSKETTDPKSALKINQAISMEGTCVRGEIGRAMFDTVDG